MVEIWLYAKAISWSETFAFAVDEDVELTTFDIAHLGMWMCMHISLGARFEDHTRDHQRVVVAEYLALYAVTEILDKNVFCFDKRGAFVFHSQSPHSLVRLDRA